MSSEYLTFGWAVKEPQGLTFNVVFHRWFANSSLLDRLIVVIVATWNVNSLRVRLPRVTEWLQQVNPDVLCLQETKMSDEDFPSLSFKELGYEAVHFGEGGWNGVAILSRIGLEAPIYGFDKGIEKDTQARLVSATCGGLRVHSVYVPNGRSIDSEHYQYKLDWLHRLKNHLESTANPADNVIVAGDWNVAPKDVDVWDRKFFDGLTHVTEKERSALNNVTQWGLYDTFQKRYAESPGLFSYFDYQAGRFHKKQGMRIDYILCSENLAKRSILDLVDRNARKGIKPSDHAPVVAVYGS